MSIGARRDIGDAGAAKLPAVPRCVQSAGNLARDAAHASGLAVIDIAERDVDVPLSALGVEQSARLPAVWLAPLLYSYDFASGWRSSFL
jgi:hypothetical protein